MGQIMVYIMLTLKDPNDCYIAKTHKSRSRHCTYLHPEISLICTPRMLFRFITYEAPQILTRVAVGR